MNRTTKLFLVAAFALAMVSYSFANEWLPPDIIRAIEAPVFQPDSLGTKNNPENRRADNPTNVEKSGKQTAGRVVQTK
ncbi:MAG TPA: hypothetical protein VMC85_02150 [Desulfomonilaceae bacterium]|nr:hypothetical protein [Desulfomonilaceae bacterium]